jgi:hypothetical protein
MQFDILTVTVDGSLSNPLVLISVALWTAFLASMSAAFVLRLLAPQAGLRSWHIAALLASIGFAYWATPFFQQRIGTVVYAIDSLLRGERVASGVCFLGGPPSAPAWVGGVISAALAGIRAISNRNRAQSTNEGAA